MNQGEKQASKDASKDRTEQLKLDLKTFFKYNKRIVYIKK